MAKADKALVQRRVDDLLRIRLDGAQWWDIREFVREKEQEQGSAWFLAEGEEPLSDSQIRRYQQKADKLVYESHERSRRKLFRRHLAQRRNLFARAATSGELSVALAVLKDEAELLGLYPPKKVAPTDPSGKKPYEGGMSDADRAAALAALYGRMARLGQGAGGPALDGAGGAGGPPPG
jgi:hypothetical protein